MTCFWRYVNIYTCTMADAAWCQPIVNDSAVPPRTSTTTLTPLSIPTYQTSRLLHIVIY